MTFHTPGDRDKLYAAGSITVKGFQVTVRDPNFNVTYVSVCYAPLEMSTDVFSLSLSP